MKFYYFLKELFSNNSEQVNRNVAAVIIISTLISFFGVGIYGYETVNPLGDVMTGVFLEMLGSLIALITLVTVACYITALVLLVIVLVNKTKKGE